MDTCHQHRHLRDWTPVLYQVSCSCWQRQAEVVVDIQADVSLAIRPSHSLSMPFGFVQYYRTVWLVEVHILFRCCNIMRGIMPKIDKMLKLPSTVTKTNTRPNITRQHALNYDSGSSRPSSPHTARMNSSYIMISA